MKLTTYRIPGFTSSMFAVVFTITLTADALLQAAPFGRYLSTPTATSLVGAYNDASPVAFDKNVVVGGNTLGSIDFDYDPYVGQGATPTIGGAALSGGFYLGNMAGVASGFTLAWVQTVSATITGGNQFNLPNTGAGTFPDADPTDAAAAAFRAANGLPALNPTFAPAYVFDSPAVVNPPTANPNVGFQDFPNRNFADGAQSWLAELGLVAISNTKNAAGFRTVDVIDTFLWGFNINVGPNSVSAFAPGFFGAPTSTYLNTLNSFYSGTSPTVGGNAGVTTDKYQFVFDQSALILVPEPGTASMLIIGVVVLAILKKRQALA